MAIRNVPQSLLFVIVNFASAALVTIIFVLQYPIRYLYCRLTPSHSQLSNTGFIVTENQSQLDEKPKDTILLIHGYPDSPAIWDHTVHHLTSLGYRCLVVELPGCKGQEVKHPIDLPDFIDQIHHKVIAHMDLGKKLTVIGHDWGSIFSQMLKEKDPDLIHRIVLLDVAANTNGSRVGLLWNLSLLSYHLLFACIYNLGNPIGTYLLRWFMKYFFQQLFPHYDLRRINELRSDMTWMYVSSIKMIMQKAKEKIYHTLNNNSGDQNISESCSSHKTHYGSQSSSSAIPGEMTPTLLLYGTDKPFDLHDSECIDRAQSTPNGLVEGWDCGHWIHIEKEEQYLSKLRTWLEKTDIVVSR